jgi:leucine-rich repeat protein SHOC2
MIGQLTGLTDLNLACNELSSLPSEIGHLTRLRVLDVSGNDDLIILPNEFSKLVKCEIIV